MTKRFFSSIILILLSIFIGLVIGEVALRIYGIQPSIGGLSVFEFDETIGWKIKPKYKLYRSTPYYAHFNYYNANGLPTDKASFDSVPDKESLSIALIGDSFVESYYVPYEKSFPYLLEKKLGDKQIINLGVSGYAPDQYLIQSRYKIKDYNINDIVVVFFPHNDVPDVYEQIYNGYSKPYFENDFSVPVNLPLTNQKQEKEKNIIKRIIKNTSIYTLLRPIIKSSETSKQTVTPEFYNRRYTEEQIKKPLALINQIKEENPEKNLFVYYVPVYEEYNTAETYDHNIGIYKKICAEMNMRCETMDAVLTQEENTSNLYIIGDGHFSEKGSALVAEHLYELLTVTPTTTTTAEHQQEYEE